MQLNRYPTVEGTYSVVRGRDDLFFLFLLNQPYFITSIGVIGNYSFISAIHSRVCRVQYIMRGSGRAGACETYYVLN